MARPRITGRDAPGITLLWADPDDPEAVRQSLLELSYGLDDFKVPLAASSALLQADVERRFETATDPSGRGWEPWADSYAPWALKRTTGRVFPDAANLHLTGEMHRQVTDPSNWIITEHDVFLDTSTIDDKWAWNNFGAYDRQGNAGTTDETGYEFGSNDLPERSFLGGTPLTRNKIIAMFNAWFRGEVTVATSSKGRKFFRRLPK